MHLGWSPGELYQDQAAFRGRLTALLSGSIQISGVWKNEASATQSHLNVSAVNTWGPEGCDPGESINPSLTPYTCAGSSSSCSVLEQADLPKTEQLRDKHGREVLLAAHEPSWLQQKSETINSIKLTSYAWCCSTALSKMYPLTCTTRIFPFVAVTQLSIIC